MKKMKTVACLSLLAASALAGVRALSTPAPAYAGSNFAHVWKLVQDLGPYQDGQLPTFQAGLADLLSWTGANIKQAAARTVSDQEDVLPNFQKLVHANGICFAGTWTITEDNPYTGYFAPGSRGQIIARISEASGHPLAGDYRAFGFAGKIYPTTDAADTADLMTANFQTIDNLGGTLARHFTDVALINQPPTTPNSQFAKTADRALAVASAFRLADSHIGVRQVYEISELGLSNPAEARTPTWMMIRAAAGTPKIDQADFRDELRLANYGGKLTFDILVAASGEGAWTRVGAIELTGEALGVGCDHNLHFHHPKWRNDLH